MVKRKHSEQEPPAASTEAQPAVAALDPAELSEMKSQALAAISTASERKIDPVNEQAEFDGDSSFVQIGAGAAEGKGKAKEDGVRRQVRRDGKEKINMTVFVSSLPYETTTTDLITHFSFIGPVKNGFVVKDKESQESKGVGYITFTSLEDAEKAVKDLNGGQFGADAKRKIRVELANDKPFVPRPRRADPTLDSDVPSLPGHIHTDTPTPTPVAAVRTKPVQPRGHKAAPATATAAGTAGPAAGHGDKTAIRTLVLSGIPTTVDRDTLWKKVRKLPGIGAKDAFEYPVNLSDLVAGEVKETMGNTAHVLFETHDKASKAAEKLHSHIYKGALLSCVLKKRLQQAAGSADGKGGNRAGRLIVRNLAWNVTEQELRTLFLPFGPILGINLPTVASKLPHTDPTKPAPPPRARGFAFVWFLSKNDAEKAIEGMNGKEIKERSVAVDWALSKEKFEEAKAAEGEGDAVKEDVKDEESEEKDEDEEDEDEDDVDVVMEDVEEDEAKPVKPTLPAVEEGSTLFIRNLPFEATEEELRDLFRTFGPLRYAKITMDRETGRSRGTGFACFWKKEDADSALAEAARVHQITGANQTGLNSAPSVNPFALPSILTIDPSSQAAAKLVLHGRTLDVVRALTREDASIKKEDAEKFRQKADKRNTYLMREGVIFPNAPAASTLPELEVTKRVESFNTRRKLLESNPSLYISKTRLSIRQIPLYATDRTIKRLGIYAVKEFDAEVAAEKREPLSREELMDDTQSPVALASSKKNTGRKTVVMQSKVERQNDRIDGVTGLGRSKGYGFLEMRTHQDALKVLRWANNNPDVSALMKEWVATELEELATREKEKLVAARAAVPKPDDLDDQELKYKKLQAKVKDGVAGLTDQMKQGKTLLVEFSVENVQVVKRRSEKMTMGAGEAGAARGGERTRKRKADNDDDEDDTKSSARKDDKGKERKRGGGGSGKNKEKRSAEDGGQGDAAVPGKSPRPSKKPKKDDGASVPAGADVKDKTLGKNLGGLIGKKRKMRKAGGK
ncbi:hypothetical protein QFC22_006554 [Naganishia vaughanmartiniae]|uniref:Uncharacterized protein n=1 Tax=Naganishia vaughanmartiniae TaxID=1424756 RepID=A0ACC2WJA4_9TREE|nr:hypothetical protein QFC22_006554 [Naganishia vaughanmartiniae]